MDLFYTIGIPILTLGVLISFHEYGHFWVARRCGVKVIRFSIGFGKKLFSWHDKKGTEYVLAAIPLGGYVKMLDEREGEVPEDQLPYAFTQKSIAQRMAIVAAGPIANFILAVLAYWVLFVHGISGVAPIVGQVAPGSLADIAGLEPGQEIVAIDNKKTETVESLLDRLVGRIGDSGEMVVSAKYNQSDLIYNSRIKLDSWLVGTVDPNVLKEFGLILYRPEISEIKVSKTISGSPAEKAGLRPDDKITQVDSNNVENMDSWIKYVESRPDTPIQLTIMREGQEIRKMVVPQATKNDAGEIVGRVGVYIQEKPVWPEEYLRNQKYGLVESGIFAVSKTWQKSLEVLGMLKKLLTGLISPKNLSGPITIAKVASTSARLGLEYYLGLFAYLSISLGVLNLLPIPVLDGGHLLFQAVEFIKGSPVSERIQLLGYQLGMSLVLCIMLFAIYNDVMRWI